MAEFIKPQDIRTIEQSVRVSVQFSRVRAALASGLGKGLLDNVGKNVTVRIKADIERRIAEVLSAGNTPPFGGNSSYHVQYHPSKTISGVPSFRVQVWFRLTDGGKQDSVDFYELPRTYTVEQVAYIMRGYDGMRDYADRLEQSIPRLPACVNAYNAALLALQAAIEPLCDNGQPYVMSPYSNFFKV